MLLFFLLLSPFLSPFLSVLVDKEEDEEEDESTRKTIRMHYSLIYPRRFTTMSTRREWGGRGIEDVCCDVLCESAGCRVRGRGLGCGLVGGR